MEDLIWDGQKQAGMCVLLMSPALMQVVEGRFFFYIPSPSAYLDHALVSRPEAALLHHLV